jgi:predicted ferric reductase
MFKNLFKILYLFFLPGITVILWGFDTFKFGFFPNSWMSYLAQIIGVLAIGIMTLNITLSSRIMWIENLFGGLDKVLKLHATTGKTAFYLIIFHPILFSIKNFIGLETLLLYFFPGNIFAYNVGIIAYWLLISLVVLTITVKLPYHIWKWTHRLMIVPLVLACMHGYFNNEFATPIYKNWFLVLSSIGTLAYLHRQIWYEYIGPVFKYRLKNKRVLGMITEMEFEPVGKKLIHIPGQFIFLTFLNNRVLGIEAHPFSISSGTNSDLLRISAKNSGDYTAKLQSANIGDSVKITGPHGLFSNKNDKSDQIWIAGGIGVTPFLSMLSSENETREYSISFIYSTKNEAEAVYKDEILSKATKLHHVKAVFHTSDGSGFLNGNKIKELTGYSNLSEKNIYLCGPMIMMNNLQKELMELGVEKSKIIFEDFSLK